MDVETLGHAGLLLRGDANEPLLFTDPWIVGSCYWRSWWLQHYPTPELVDELKRVPFCFITHEHPDHFHTASIRTLGAGVHYLCPDLPEEHMARFLSGEGYTASVVPAFEWRTLRPGVRILSIPLFNDDSTLLIDTPAALIVNLNDSKPRGRQLRQLRRWLDAAVPGKRRVLLSSYSPASIVNSFMRDAERVSLKEKADYVRYIGANCTLLGIDDYMPFASQAVYRRSDSTWANAFKVTFEDLRAHWCAEKTRLLPPYSRLRLADGAFTFVPPDRYDAGSGEIQRKVADQQALDERADFTEEDGARLERKLDGCRALLAPLFPRGIGFVMPGVELHYNPWSGVLSRGAGRSDFALRVPVQAFKEALEYGHVGDLGTTMFTLVQLHSGIHPWRVYLFFFIMSLHDYGHATTLRGWTRWLRHVVRVQSWRIPEARLT